MERRLPRRDEHVSDQAEDITHWRHGMDQAPAEVELLAEIVDQRT